MAQIHPDSAAAVESSAPPSDAVVIKAPRASMRRQLVRTLRSLLIIYIGVCVGMGCLQDKIIFPGAASQGQKTAVVPPSPKYELIELRTREGDRTFAVFAKASDSAGQVLSDAAIRPTAIMFYGNGACLAYALDLVSYFREMGINVMAVEYVGYGMASGKPGEKSFYATADAAYEHLVARPDVDRNRVIVIGMSIGCAPAIDLATRKPIVGIVCFSPFTSMPAMGRQVIPWLPTSLILSYRFDNLTKIKSITVPIFITHGRQDRTVPFYMSEELARAAKGPVTFIPYDDADHNDLLDVGGDALSTELRRFLSQFFDNRKSVGN